MMRLSESSGFTKGKPSLDITARCYGDDETYNAVRTELQKHFRVSGGQTACFSEDNIASVVIGLTMATLQAMPANLISSALYDGIKIFLAKRKKQDVSYFAFTVKRGKDEVYTSGHVETRDPEILREAFATFRDVAITAQRGDDWVFEDDQQKWRIVTDEERREEFVRYLMSFGERDENEVRDLVSKLEPDGKSSNDEA